MANIFPEGSYFYDLFNQHPDLIVEIRSNLVSVFSLDHGKTGFYPEKLDAPDDITKTCQDVAESIKDLM